MLRVYQLTNDNSSFVKTHSSTRHRFDKCSKRTKSTVIIVHLQKKSTMKAIAEQLEHEVPKAMKRSIDLAKEKGASTWLSVLSLIKYDLLLHKSAFYDELCLRYGWLPPCLADTCPVVKNSRLIMLLPVQLVDIQQSDTTKYAIPTGTEPCS